MLSLLFFSIVRNCPEVFNTIVHTNLNEVYVNKPHLAIIRDKLAKLRKSSKKQYQSVEVLWPVEAAVVAGKT